MTLETTATTRDLAAFASGIRYEDLPREVSERAKELFLDWVAATLAGKGASGACPGAVSRSPEPQVRTSWPQR